jgi:hypothetical protein
MNRIKKAKECDATGDDSSNIVDIINKKIACRKQFQKRKTTPSN